MQEYYNEFAEPSKSIAMRLGYDTYFADVPSTLKEGDEAYNALRQAFVRVLEPSYDIIIWHPGREEKVRLDYKHLHTDVEHRIEMTLKGRQQGPGVSASGGYKKVQRHIEAIRGHWKLGDDSEILPGEMAPRDDGGNLIPPCDWSARSADEVRKLSGHSVDRHEVAIGYLVAAMRARCVPGVDTWEVTSGDCKAAMARMMASTADQAYVQLPEERVDTQLFAGGLAEAAQQALEETEGEGAAVGSGYEEGGKFNIGTHSRSA